MSLNVRQLVEDAFLAGWRSSLEAYSVWKDGQQVTAMGRNMREEQKTADKNAKDYFDAFLEQQRRKVEET